MEVICETSLEFKVKDDVVLVTVFPAVSNNEFEFKLTLKISWPFGVPWIGIVRLTILFSVNTTLEGLEADKVAFPPEILNPKSLILTSTGL